MIYSIFKPEQNTILKAECKKFMVGDRVDDIIHDLIVQLNTSDIPGIGLAAPQIGINKQVFVVRLDGECKAFINPEITWRSRNIKTKTERCLSVPGFKARITRNEDIIITFMDIHANKTSVKYTGDKARLIQHEYDHLQGITINKKSVLVKDN